MAGAEADDWHVPLTVRVDAALLTIPAAAAPPAPPSTLPVTRTFAPAEEMLIPCAPLLFVPPVMVPVKFRVAPPSTATPEALDEVPPVTAPVWFNVPEPLTLIPMPLLTAPPTIDPTTFSVPEDGNATKELLGVALVWLKFDTTLADDPAPSPAVVMQLVVVAP